MSIMFRWGRGGEEDGKGSTMLWPHDQQKNAFGPLRTGATKQHNPASRARRGPTRSGSERTT